MALTDPISGSSLSTLEANVGVRLGSLHLDVELHAHAGEMVALLGPNGAGKSTLLRCLAGLLPLDHGSIVLDGVVLDDPQHDVLLPPEKRACGVVFQDYLLFDNMSALDNVAFGLRARGRSRADARRHASEWIERVGLGDHAGHRPRELSGGQRQRVALARAMATAPRLLLLDEPLAALDAGTRRDVRRDLRRHLADFEGVRLLVTHDPVDAYALADRVVVLEAGRVVQTGTLSDVTAQPRSRYVAELVGTNLLAGRADGTTLTLDGGLVLTTADSLHGEAYASIHPSAVALYRAAPDGSPRNVWSSVVTDVDTHLDRSRVQLSGPVVLSAEITPAAVEALGVRLGDTLWVSVKATEIALYPR
jgi:molybdate transport system ATP-binding protein